MSNIIVFTTEIGLASFKSYRIGYIEGTTTPTFKAFYQAIEKALSFPDDFEHNLESLDELLNDMSWIKQHDVAICIKDSASFLSQEKPLKVLELINLLDATAEDWKWIDDDEEIQPKNLRILIQYSPRLMGMLEKEEIAYEKL